MEVRKMVQMPPLTAFGRILAALHFACPTNWWASCFVYVILVYTFHQHNKPNLRIDSVFNSVHLLISEFQRRVLFSLNILFMFNSVSEQQKNPDAIYGALKTFEKAMQLEDSGHAKYMGSRSVEDLSEPNSFNKPHSKKVSDASTENGAVSTKPPQEQISSEKVWTLF